MQGVTERIERRVTKYLTFKQQQKVTSSCNTQSSSRRLQN